MSRSALIPQSAPLVQSARRLAWRASLIIAIAAMIAGAVRLLPWLLDPEVPWRAAAPFACGLAGLALEAALVVGWPVGWALACARAIETGEARVLQSLGEAPLVTVRRFAPHGAVFAAVLSAVAVAVGSDAASPGRVANELMGQARASCEAARAPAPYLVPFTGISWLCAPDRPPRLAGMLSGVVLTARGARIAGDFRAIELDDARLALPGDAPTVSFAVHVDTLSIRGLAPWAHASTLPPALRAMLLALGAWGAASLAALALLRAGTPRAGLAARATAIGLGACGPLAALGLLRFLERKSVSTGVFVSVPLAAWACAAAAGALLSHLALRKSRC